jgi:hypothetical protein
MNPYEEPYVNPDYLVTEPVPAEPSGAQDAGASMHQHASDAADQVRQGVQAAQDRAGDVAQQVQDQAGQLVQQAQDRAGQLGQQAGQVAQQMQEQAKEMAQQMRAQLTQFLTTQKDQAASVIEEIATVIDHISAQLRTDGQVALANALDGISMRLRGFATDLHQKSLDQLIHDIEQGARSQTALLIAGGLVVGLLAARLIANARQAQAS